MENVSYAYELPKDLIASQPASPRDSARLFIYDTVTDKISFDHFLHLDQYLPIDSLLVLNDTKVAPARAYLQKETGGKIEALFLLNEWDEKGPIPTWLDRKAHIGGKLFFDAKTFFTVMEQNEDVFYLKPNFDSRNVLAVLEKKGRIPIPRYIKAPDLPEAEFRRKYQTVFAKKPASVAAPTASLHFTQRVLAKLQQKGIRKTFLTLDVGRGTFAPVRDEQISAGTLHTEPLFIPQKTASLIRSSKEQHKPVVAVGTTAVRALESAAKEILSGTPHDIRKTTNIFIRPGSEFKIVDTLMTNFHLPSTSLMMLVQAFLEHKKAQRTIVDLYEIAVKEQFRFFSFGDTMLIK